MVRHLIQLAMITGVVFSVSGCATDPKLVGGPCTYKETAGIATIVSIEDATTATDQICPTPKEVKFSFATEVSVESAPSPDCGRALCMPNNQISGEYLKVPYGSLNPPEQWLKEQGITVGSHHKAVKKEIVSGTCTPVLYAFSDLNFDRAQTICTGR